ncbi:MULTISPECIES: hypothetical protein [unclassified Streptomyces]|uniref:hypothetical protein n=1 Tax=Streptomyces sp. NPDC127129 TaxID=3345373 RepID=UPI003636E8E1
MAALGDLIEIDDRTRPVLGQGPALAQGRPDVADALVHRTGDTDPNAMFTAMTAVNQLREPGLRPESGDADAVRSRPVPEAYPSEPAA